MLYVDDVVTKDDIITWPYNLALLDHWSHAVSRCIASRCWFGA